MVSCTEGERSKQSGSFLRGLWWMDPDHISKGATEPLNCSVAHGVVRSHMRFLHTSNLEHCHNQTALKVHPYSEFTCSGSHRYKKSCSRAAERQPRLTGFDRDRTGRA